MTIRMVDTLTQYEHIREEVDAAIADVLKTGAYINGPWVNSFRKNLAEYLGVKHVIACANGTDALQIALMALELKPGDEVITAPFTFFATAEVVALLQLKPVFVDVDPDTFNLDVNKLEAAITPRTKAIVPVHLFGLPADMAPIMEIAEKHGIFVVEDNAQALGSTYTFPDGLTKRAGAIGHIGCTSFYPSKNLGAYGDAGAIFTNDDVLGERLQTICNHGSNVRYYHERIGVNSRLDSIQAAVLDIKLRHLDKYNASRSIAADLYDEFFAGTEGIATPVRTPNSKHVFHQYTLRILPGRAKRDAMQKMLQERGVPSMIYYPVSLHQQEAYAEFGYKDGDFPVSEQLTAEVLSLPMHSELTPDQVEYIAKAVVECFNA